MMTGRQTQPAPCEAVTNTGDLEPLMDIYREEAGLDPLQRQEMRERRCLARFRERVQAISRLGVEARRKKAAERRAAQAAEDTGSPELNTTE